MKSQSLSAETMDQDAGRRTVYMNLLKNMPGGAGINGRNLILVITGMQCSD